MTTPTHQTIQSMYEAINRRDVSAALAWVDDNCIYQDLNFPQPFCGKAAVKQLFEEFCAELPPDLQFVIDDITTGNSLAVGILWHLELDGIPLPNGRGTSFCRLSKTSGKLIFARDLVEPPLKPGKVAFFILRLIMPLVRRLPPQFLPERDASGLSGLLPNDDLASQSSLQPATDSTSETGPRQPWLALLLGLLAVSYIYLLFWSPADWLIPGEPVWALRPETIQAVWDESIDFFFILPLANAAGIHLMEAPQINPVLAALFNLAEAWIFMFLPLLLADPRERRFSKVTVWGLAMFLTNAILTPYMALRANVPQVQMTESSKKGWLARGFGLIGLAVGSTALVWFVVANPDFGDLAARWHYLGEQLLTNRLTLAFCVDLGLLAVFQAMLLRAVEPADSWKQWLRFVPFWGLAAWLVL